MKNTRAVTLTALVAASAMVLAACSSSSSSSGSSTPSTSSAAPAGSGSAPAGSSSTSAPSTTAATSAPPNGTLIYGEGTTWADNLMPLISAGNATSVANIEVRLLDGAFRIAPNISFVPDPDQATSATSSMVGGQQVVDIKINPKAVWADGQPITAADYVFTASAQKSSDPAKGGCAALLSTTGFDQIESGKAVSTTEVQFTFIKGKPFADWKGLFSGSSALIMSKHVFDKGTPAATCAYITAGWPIAQGIPLGAQNGPWLLQASGVDAQSHVVTLTPNPKYWGAAPKLARIVYDNIGSDSDTNVKAMQNGEINMIYPQPQLDLIANLKKLSNVTTTVNFGINFEHFDFNTKDPLLAKPEVRQAIAYAIDRKALVSATIGQFSTTAQVLGNRLLVNNQTGYVDNSGGYNTQNIAKAKSLLEGAGATMGSDGYYSIGGKELDFKVITTQNNALRDQTITIAAQQVKAAGIKLTEVQDPDIFGDASKPQSLAAEGFQIALFAWSGSPSLSSNNALYASPVKGAVGQNYTQGADPAVDAQLVKVATADTPAAQLTAVNAADKQLWSDMYSLPLYQKPTLLAYDSKFKGIADNGTNAGPLWNSDTFSVS